MEEYEIITSGNVEVGDEIIRIHCLGVSKFLITRVTKTTAFSLRESDGYEYTFQREIGWDMAKPKEEWNTITYKVHRKHKEV